MAEVSGSVRLKSVVVSHHAINVQNIRLQFLNHCFGKRKNIAHLAHGRSRHDQVVSLQANRPKIKSSGWALVIGVEGNPNLPSNFARRQQTDVLYPNLGDRRRSPSATHRHDT